MTSLATTRNGARMHRIDRAHRPRRPSQRRPYVVVVVASTVLLVGLLAWPLSVTQFRSTARLAVRFNPSQYTQPDQIQTDLRQVVARAITPDQLKRLIGVTASRHSITSPELDPANSTELRQAVRIVVSRAPSSDLAEIKLSLVGSGSADEQLFINLLASHIATAVARQVETPAHDWVAQRAGRIDAELKDASTTWANSLDQIAADLEEFEIDLSSQLDSLRIGTDSARLATASHDLNRAAPGIRVATDKQAGAAGSERPQRTVNQFFQASSKNQPAPLAVLIDRIQQLSLRPQRQQLTDVNRSISDFAQSNASVVAAAASANFTPSWSIDTMYRAIDSQPIGGVPSRDGFLVLTMIALMFGGIVAWQYNPQAAATAKNAAQAAASLGIPLLGVIRLAGRAARHRQDLSHWCSTLVLRCCECVLALMVAAMLLAMAVNSSVLGALLENPYHAVTKIVWMFAPN